MAIRITCPGCQAALTLDDKMRGKKVRCKACEKVLSIPAASGKAKALARTAADEEEAVQDRPRVKVGKTSVPAEYDGDPEDDGAKKKKKKKGKKGTGVLIIGGVAAIVVVLIAVGGLSAVMYFKPEEQKKKPQESVAQAPEVKEKDERMPARIVVPGIKEGNPAKKGGTGVISNVRGAAYRAERRSELRQIGLSYVQYADDYKGANRNQQTWLEYIKTFGPIHESVMEGYYKMNFNARLEAGSVIAYERDIDNGQAHLCVRGDGSVDHVPLAELKTILGRDP
jgi:ribosomal protein S27E